MEHTLAGLAKQQGSVLFEVIVIENGASDGSTERCVERYQDQVPIRYLYASEANLNAARNKGCEAAMGEIIALLDDDCVPETNWTLSLETPIKNILKPG